MIPVEALISPVRGQPLAVVVQGDDFAVRQGDAAVLVAPAVVAVGVLVDVVAQVDDVVDRVLVDDVTVRVEEPKWVVRAGKHSQLDVGHLGATLGRDGLRPAYYRLDVRVADVELVPFPT